MLKNKSFKWISTWKYLPVEYGMEMAVVENRTQRVSFWNNLSGTAVRILLSNKYSRVPLTIDCMTVGEEENGKLISCVPVTLKGSAVINLAPGEEVFSDTVSLNVQPGRKLAVSLYVGEKQSVESVCCYWARSNTRVVVNEAGNETSAQQMTGVNLETLYPSLAWDKTPEKAEYFFGFSAVQVLAEDDARLLACFGDSITHMSYVTGELTHRLYEMYPGKLAVINCGIGGNRLMHDAIFIAEAPAQGRVYGAAGVTRFEHDIYGIDEPDCVLVLEGINDIMHPIQLSGAAEATPACVITAGYEMLIGVAHRHGSRICGATVMPVGSDAYPAEWMEAFEVSRTAVNDWLRANHTYDALFDYDAAVRDPERPAYMQEGLSIGDGLHPGYEGARCIVDAIDLATLLGDL